MVGGIAINTAGGATIKEIPIPNAASVPAPSFKTPLTFLASLQLSPDVQTLLQQKYTADVATLSANAVDFDAWIDLGEARKLGGDYAGAAADWEYVSVIYPKNIVSFANLGDLYTNFLPNYPKAAANYEHEIANNPAYEDSYSDLFSLFTNQYPQGTTTPQNVLKEGIAASPQSVDLYVLLARYYVSKGDTADAKIEYQVAIAQAQAQKRLFRCGADQSGSSVFIRMELFLGKSDRSGWPYSPYCWYSWLLLPDGLRKGLLLQPLPLRTLCGSAGISLSIRSCCAMSITLLLCRRTKHWPPA